MSSIQKLLTDHIGIWTGADAAKRTGRGRASSNANSVYGVKKLRELILELAVRGKLVPQDSNDEPASALLKRIQAEKEKLVKTGKVKKDKPLAEITDEEKPFELPSGWGFVHLQDICAYIQRGKGPIYADFGSVRVVSQKCVQWKGFDIEQSRYVSDESLSVYQEERFLQNDDLLWNSTGTGTVGRIAVLQAIELNTLVADSHVTIIRPVAVSSRFLCAYISSPNIQKRIEPGSENALVSGTTNQVELNTSSAMNVVIPVPPLAEQNRIVAKVDELMALCDQLEAQHNNAAEAHEKIVSVLLQALTQSADANAFADNWQRIAAHFDTLFTTEASIDALKQTLLQLAVMGKLVPQDVNDEPAIELLKKIRAEKDKLIKAGKIKKDKPLAEITEEEKPFALPSGWEWVRVATVSELITSGSRDWAKYLSDDGAIFVTMGNLSRGSYELRLENMRYVNPPKNGEGNRTRLETHDLLISITGDVGNLGRIPENFGEAYINQHTCLLRFLPLCRNRYFPEVLRSPIAAFQFNAPQRGIKNSFRLGDVDEMVIPLAPMEEQHRIVAKADELMALCDQLKTRISEAARLQQKIADVVVEGAVA